MDSTTCKKVTSMMSLYIDDKLSEDLKAFVEDHLLKCPSCNQKYEQMKHIIQNLKTSYEKILQDVEHVETENVFNIREYEKFYSNISAYIDNELEYDEGVEFRKYLLKSKTARNELQSMYNMQAAVKNSFFSFKCPKEVDCAKKIIKQLKAENVIEIRPQFYQKVAIIAGICILSSTGMYIFSNVDKTDKKDVKPALEKVKEQIEEQGIETKSYLPFKEHKT